MLDDFMEEDFIVVTDAHLNMIETIRNYVNHEQYLLLYEMFDFLKKMRSGTDDRSGWEYAYLFIRKYFEPVYLEYFSVMDEVDLMHIVKENVLETYNGLVVAMRRLSIQPRGIQIKEN